MPPKKAKRPPFASRAARRTNVFEARDTSTLTVPAHLLLGEVRPRDVAGTSAVLAVQFRERNAVVLHELDTTLDVRFDGRHVDLSFRTGATVGAVPLVSPVSGRADFGIVVRPRFEWSGLGPMLAQMGWRIVPDPLPFPLLPQSDRKIPRWVLASIVLFRIQALIKQLGRRFEMIDEVHSAPKGTVDWSRYATHHVANGQLLHVPCRYPDLRDDRELKAAIHFTLRRQLASLQSVDASSTHVRSLISLGMQLLTFVSNVPEQPPQPKQLAGWLRGTLKTPEFRRGLEAIEWSAQERGLAGLSDLQGLPWRLPMETFFEAWSETVLHAVARTVGGVVRTGRRRETIAALSWQPPFLGSQRYLLPDVMLERDDLTVIVDAKYKEHWEEMRGQSWHDLADELRERHRADLLQVLAYANLARSSRIVVCLAYPCSADTWHSLRQRGHLVHRAMLNVPNRDIALILTAFPMGVPVGEVAAPLAAQLAMQ